MKQMALSSNLLAYNYHKWEMRIHNFTGKSSFKLVNTLTSDTEVNYS